MNMIWVSEGCQTIQPTTPNSWMQIRPEQIQQKYKKKDKKTKENKVEGPSKPPPPTKNHKQTRQTEYYQFFCLNFLLYFPYDI